MVSNQIRKKYNLEAKSPVFHKIRNIERKFGLMIVCLSLLQACANPASSQNDLSATPNSQFFPLRWYQGPLHHLAAVRRGECPMYPSCSEYCSQAIARHGWVLGWIMAADRLMRCGRDEMKLARRIRVEGNWKFYDPVESNDFWWYRLSDK